MTHLPTVMHIQVFCLPPSKKNIYISDCSFSAAADFRHNILFQRRPGNMRLQFSQSFQHSTRLGVGGSGSQLSTQPWQVTAEVTAEKELATIKRYQPAQKSPVESHSPPFIACYNLVGGFNHLETYSSMGRIIP